jgi:hypothetical protein
VSEPPFVWLLGAPLLDLTHMPLDRDMSQIYSEYISEQGPIAERGTMMADQSGDYAPDARQVLAGAEAEARAMRHGYIGQEHLLLALLGTEEGPVAAILGQFGVSAGKIREAVVALVPPGTRVPEGELPLTPRLKQALRLAADEAATAGQSPPGAAHLLCGLLLEGTGVGAGVLQSLGATLERVRATYRPLPFDVAATQAAMTDMFEQDRGVKRYLLALPVGLYQEVQDLADRQHTNVADLLRRFTRLGLLATRIQETPGAALVIREGDAEQRVLLL